jgi:hypothetical protein
MSKAQDLEAKIARLKQRREQLDAQLADAKAKAATATRKAEARRKIIIGGAVEAALAAGIMRVAVPDPATPDRWVFGTLEAVLERIVTRADQRQLVGLANLSKTQKSDDH